MKNDQKNPIYPSVLFSCMIKQVNLMFNAEQGKNTLKDHVWVWNLNLWFKLVQTLLVLVALAQHTHIAMFHACIILSHIVWWWLCIGVLATGSASEEYRDYPNEESYPCIEPSGKQPTIWSYRYNPMFSLLLSFTALRQRDSNCCVLR